MLTGSGLGDESGNGKTITLSSLLNFTDGLWSCCGSETTSCSRPITLRSLIPRCLEAGGWICMCT
ncbi:hypothetical protein F2Q70_00042802 [Brassica cretica]|uniref:Uncharacterized protein n=1 Tax=Brassica cretica TaxID=69181 RepID=A0A8S9LJR0_BRACR|nr:hypothetical protein F2Q70_00042802 [Brassica cretica]KAF2606231.1 hypothetical protein F2Q68_00043622 [Brassica cretica]